MRNFCGLIIALTAILFLSNDSFGCSCIRQITCQYSQHAAAAFTGTVVDSVLKNRKFSGNGSNMHDENVVPEYDETIQISRVSVTEAFWGTNDRSELLIETEISSSCGMKLITGEKMLFYASKDPESGSLSIHYCSGSKVMTDAEDDLKYLRENKNKRSTLSGTVGFGEWGSLDPKPLQKFGVNTVQLLGGEETLYASIQHDGTYKFSDILAGSYRLSVILPDWLITQEKYHPDIAKELNIPDQSEIKIGERGCVIEDFPIIENGRIRGRITNADGKPVEEITVTLVPLDDKGRPIATDDDAVDSDLNIDANEDGEFSFKGIRSGKYLVGIRLKDWICNDCIDAEYQKTYFPGVATEKLARPVTVKTGNIVNDVDFKLTRKYVEREIKGRVVDKENRPVPNAKVFYVARTPDRKMNGQTLIRTDADGYFSFSGYVGHDYLIGAASDPSDVESTAIELTVFPTKKIAEVKLILDQKENKADFWEFPKVRKRQ